MLLRDKTVIVSGVGAGLGHRVAAACVRDGAGSCSVRAPSRTSRRPRPGSTPRGTDRLAGDRHRRRGAVHGAGRTGRGAVRRDRRGDPRRGAGRAPRGLRDADFDAWRQVVDVNLFGTLRMTRACLPAMTAGGGGSVVMIGTQSSVAAPSQVQQAAYAASKGGLVSAMYSLARELGPDRIRVNTVQPGWMWGPPVEGYVRYAAQTEGVPESEVLDRLAGRMALPDLATDGDVAEAAVFLASDRARAITGQSLLVNAGELMR
ncbi:SDR family oxidoreductase [Streptomyces albulus]|nr:SDR family oxidoreductase [Streptomyces noursei]